MIDDFDCSMDDAMDSNNELNINVVDQLITHEELVHPSETITHLSSYAQSQINRLNKWAEEAIEDEKWHYDQAEDASSRGDEEAARKHIQAAKQRHDDYNT